jgi:hypothetical protein
MTSGESFNRAFRLLAGRAPQPVPERELERDGDYGGGRGGTAAMPRPRATSNADVNARLRSAARIARQFTVPGGVNVDQVDLDRLYGR